MSKTLQENYGINEHYDEIRWLERPPRSR